MKKWTFFISVSLGLIGGPANAGFMSSCPLITSAEAIKAKNSFDETIIIEGLKFQFNDTPTWKEPPSRAYVVSFQPFASLPPQSVKISLYHNNKIQRINDSCDYKVESPSHYSYFQLTFKGVDPNSFYSRERINKIAKDIKQKALEKYEEFYKEEIAKAKLSQPVEVHPLLDQTLKSLFP